MATKKKTNAKAKPKAKAKTKAKEKKSGGVAKILVPVLLLCALGAVGGMYLAFARHYQDHFFPGTIINGVDCGSLTADEVEEMLRSSAEDYALNLHFRNGQSATLRRSDIGYAYVSDGSVDRLMQEQDARKWFLAYPDKNEETHTFATDTIYDAELLRTSLYALPQLSDESRVAPTDASIAFDGTQFSIQPEDAGNQIDRELVYAAACEAVDASNRELDVAGLPGAYAAPAVTADNEELHAQADQLNSYISAKITYQLPGKEQILDSSTLVSWLSQDADGNYYKDPAVWDAHITDYVTTLADGVDTVGKDHVFVGTGIGDVTVSGGDYGWEVDRAAESAQLTEELAAGAEVSREPNYILHEFSTENGGLGDTYVEVDLSRQHLWFHKDGEIIIESNVVSGTMTSERWTPPGIFYIKWITTNVVLRGPKLENGDYEWENPVKYWMPFNGGIGLHDAPWRGYFGGEIYVWSGSHGCINLPSSVAEQVFNNITYETPVVVYYSQGYSLH